MYSQFPFINSNNNTMCFPIYLYFRAILSADLIILITQSIFFSFKLFDIGPYSTISVNTKLYVFVYRSCSPILI